MADDDYIALAVMNDQPELVEALMISDEAVRAVERIVMGLAAHF